MLLRELRPLLRPLGPRKFTCLAILLTVLLGIYTLTPSYDALRFSSLQDHWRPHRTEDTCTPQAYANGSWAYQPRTNATKMTSPEDALAFSGFEKCASSREYFWHLAADKGAQYDRFPGAQSWQWMPGAGCELMKPLNPEALVKLLVEDGGWYLVGDSVTENHFFSLSCILYPHVIATPDYTTNSHFDRAWPQNLYLSPSSPMIQSLSLPDGFDISTTALVTFRRIDILLSKQELIDIHSSIQAPGQTLNDSSLFSDESVWTLPVDEYIAEFLAPLPKANHATMVVSTGGHWTVTLFSKVSPPGIQSVLALFNAAMQRWSQRVQNSLLEANRDLTSWRWGRPTRLARKRAVVRAYLPGHESCHTFREPWAEVQPFVWNWYNWGNIWEFNDIFERILAPKRTYPDIDFLPIDRPARLRPDAHTTGDCLHIMAGAGVLEGWTHYIWHFLSRDNAR
ncbi:hypothetical protein GALMADRAFT_79374 [Galerina marginata CBS 339.88]|uniref:Uncharacterized protein n=1 Tax=Galerina marginata (strain CBS 339.88) TaxID=685588 RepID=A0A067SCV3_GALM3|nr:hypothetical protein GALMADRAFT_79374 [Galerina marginata CBS 339.88]